MDSSSVDCKCCKIKSVFELFENNELVSMCAPMVRYSKMAFRMLVRSHGCNVAFTPMIVSNSFVKSLKARNIDFFIAAGDRPLIAQFAGKNAYDLMEATNIVYNYTDGVDINCGCPQRWAIDSGYGACLLDKPELVSDMIHQMRNKVNDSKYTISMKIRLHTDIIKTVELCRRAEKAGATWITVHGRTKLQRTEPVDYNAIKTIKENVSIPVVGNGDIFSLNDALALKAKTGVNGVMCARGLLQNPSLFTGADSTPISCIKDWLNFSLLYGNTFTNFHHHLMFMTEKNMPKHERKILNSYSSLSSVLDHFNKCDSFQ